MFWLFFIPIILFTNYLHHHYGDCGVLNWNFSLPTLSQDFSTDFDLEAALENEMQADLLKITRTQKPHSNLDVTSSDVESSYPLHTMDTYYSKDIPPYDETVPNLKTDENILQANSLLNDQNDNYKFNFNLKKNSSLSKNNNGQPKVKPKKKHRMKEKTNANLFQDFVGTNLFGTDRKKCFSAQDVALLTARRDFEDLLPKQWPKFLPNDHTIKTLMNYFQTCHETILRMSSDGTKQLVQQAFFDTLGGYLHHYLLPITKYSFYAGHASLRSTNNLLQLHTDCKKILNVNGNGWKEPIQNLENVLKEIKIEPLRIDEKKSIKGPSYCLRLNMEEQSSTDDDYIANGRSVKMLVPLPKLETENNENTLSNIWLPLRRKTTYDLRADNSAYIVVKFYETVTRCYQFERANQDYFNEKFHSWIMENIQVHLTDEQFYPGLGAILRINENLSAGKSGNLYGDNLIEQDFDYGEKNDLIHKRDQGSEKQSTYHLSMQNFDDETKKFLDDISKTNVLNGLTTRWLIEGADKVNNVNPNNTVAYNLYNNNIPSTSIPLTKFNSTINTINPSTNQLDAIQNKILDPQKELKEKFEQIANQSIQSALLQGTNKKPETKNIQDLLPTDWTSPQGIALISIPIVLFLLIMCCCCCRGKRKNVPKKASRTSKISKASKVSKAPPPPTHVPHKVPVGVPIDSGSSIHSSSTDTFVERIPRAKRYVAKGPQAPETTSVSFTSSSPSKKRKSAPATLAPPPAPASKGKTAPPPPPPPPKGKAPPPPPPPKDKAVPAKKK